MTPIHIARLVAAWTQRLAAATVFRRANTLRRILRDLEYDDLPRGLTEAVPQFKQPPPRETIATPEETAKLYAQAPPFLQLFLHLLNDSGLRFAEAFRCAPENYDAKTHTVTLIVKGGNNHTVPVSPETEKLFRMHRGDPSTPYVAALHGMPSMTKGTLRWHWKKLKKQTGVNPDLWPHDIRRTTAVDLYESSKDLRAVQELLGHSHMGTTVRYLAHRDPARLRPLMRELWNKNKGEK
ncbi:MAG TPA: tyrosine-type recombinase/integrase [Verrucomicrobiae bacterium]|nr:tyrosine-type recombinase/integrase [Verrucomicrobiae bacterium]